MRDWLTERDFVVIHTRPGTNFCDVVALQKNRRPRFIEVKSTAGGPWEHFRWEDRHDLLTIAELAGAEAWLAWWPPGGKLRWFHSDEWPKPKAALRVVAASGTMGSS